MEFGAQSREIDLFEQGTDGLCAHADLDAILAAVVLNDLQILILGNDLLFGQGGLTWIEHDVAVEVEDLFKVVHGHVEQRADLGRQGLQKPDMGNRGSKFDVAHALAAHLGGNDFNAALFADNAAVLHALVLAAVALEVLHRAEDAGAEQAVTLGLEGPVVDGLGFLYFAVGPFAYGFRRGYGNLYGLQVAHIGGIARSSTVGIEIIHAHMLYVPCFDTG